MKMAFLVICPGSFQYDGERERESWTGRERETAEKVERKNRERSKTSEQRERQKSFHRV